MCLYFCWFRFVIVFLFGFYSSHAHRTHTPCLMSGGKSCGSMNIAHLQFRNDSSSRILSLGAPFLRTLHSFASLRFCFGLFSQCVNSTNRRSNLFDSIIYSFEPKVNGLKPNLLNRSRLPIIGTKLIFCRRFIITKTNSTIWCFMRI